MASVQREMRNFSALSALALVLLLAGCGGKRAEPEHPPPPPVTAQPDTPAEEETSEGSASSGVRPANPEGSFKTGEVVGEALANAWTDLKSFGEGVWSSLTGDEEN